jgi:hypothetical protein
MTAFLLTWKEGGWDHANLLNLVRRFEREGTLDIEWRLRAWRTAEEGARVWLLEQGVGRYGIFGAGNIIGPSVQGDDGTGLIKHLSPIRLTHLVDPRKEYLIGPEQTLAILRGTQWRTQASGITLDESQSAAFERLLEPTRGDWTKEEIAAIVSDYFSMLDDEIAGIPYSKAAHRRALRQRVRRPHPSIEYKHRNISAVLKGLHLRWIEGYLPAPNLQLALREAVEAQVALRSVPALRLPNPTVNLNEVFVVPPTLPSGQSNSEGVRKRVGRKTDMAGRDEKNRVLGMAGEGYVFDLERERLETEGRPDLAAQVCWASKDKGDGLGYDIESYSSDGRAIYIEVKTTRGPIESPFYLSAAELSASRDFGAAYRLYRVFDFDEDRGQVYVLTGPLERILRLEAVSYRATPDYANGSD